MPAIHKQHLSRYFQLTFIVSISFALSFLLLSLSRFSTKSNSDELKQDFEPSFSSDTFKQPEGLDFPEFSNFDQTTEDAILAEPSLSDDDDTDSQAVNEVAPETVDKESHTEPSFSTSPDLEALDTDIVQDIGADCTGAVSEAYATLVHSVELVKAVEVLAYTLKVLHSTERDLVAMVTPNIDERWRMRLQRKGIIVSEVPAISQVDTTCGQFDQGLFRFGKHKRASPFSKIAVWGLVQYRKVIYLDPTVLVSRSLDFLFKRPGFPPAASHSIFPAEFFESSLMVLTPSNKVYEEMKLQLPKLGTLDCTETSFLNLFFKGWSNLGSMHRLSPHIHGVAFLPTYDYRYVPKKTMFQIGKGPVLKSLSYISLSDGTMNTSAIQWPWTKNDKLRTLILKLHEDMRQYFKDNEVATKRLPTLTCENEDEIDFSLLEEFVPSTPTEEGHDYSKEAYVTFIQNTDENFIQSAEVLIYSLRKYVDSRRDVVAMVTPFVDNQTRERLKLSGFVLRDIEHLSHPLPKVCNASKWASSNDGNSEVAKLRVWQLEEYDKIVYIDADALILSNVDELFGRPGSPVSATHGMFPAYEFNAGVMVLQPSKAVFEDMINSFPDLGTSDCGDQGFLNAYYRNWFTEESGTHRLPTKYNTHFRLFTLRPYLDDRKLFDFISPKILHFSGRSKPWFTKLVVAGVDWADVWRETLREAQLQKRQRLREQRELYVGSIRDDILQRVRARLQDTTNIVYVDMSPTHSSRDMVTYFSEKHLLSKLGIEALYECSNTMTFGPDMSFVDLACDLYELEVALGENGIIFVHGDGLRFTKAADLESLQRKIDLIKKFPQHQIVFLPQDIDPNLPPKYLKWIAMTAQQHTDTVFFWSDHRSFELAATFMDTETVEYCPDTSFFASMPTDATDTTGQNKEPLVFAPSSLFPEHNATQLGYGDITPHVDRMSHFELAKLCVGELLHAFDAFSVIITDDRVAAVLAFLSLRSVIFYKDFNSNDEPGDVFPRLSDASLEVLPGVKELQKWTRLKENTESGLELL
jgi:glycogenin glucosyltransferase